MMVTFIILPLLFLVVFLVINNAKSKLGMALSTGGFSSGDNVEGSISVTTGKELKAERLVVTLVGVYEETRRKARSTTGYDEDEDQWDTSSTEVFRHEEELPIELPVPKGFKGELPFSFPAPRGEQVSVRTPSGGIRQGAEIPIGDLPGAGNASLTWSISVSLDGADVEPVSQAVGVALG